MYLRLTWQIRQHLTHGDQISDQPAQFESGILQRDRGTIILANVEAADWAVGRFVSSIAWTVSKGEGIRLNDMLRTILARNDTKLCAFEVALGKSLVDSTEPFGQLVRCWRLAWCNHLESARARTFGPVIV